MDITNFLPQTSLLILFSLLCRYAVLLYADEQSATETVKNAGQYWIHGQQLAVSAYRNKR